MLVQLCSLRLFLLFQSPSLFFSRRRQRAERLKLLRRQSRVGFRAGLLHLLLARRPKRNRMDGVSPPPLLFSRFVGNFILFPPILCLVYKDLKGLIGGRPQLVNVFIRSVTLRAPRRAPFSNKNTGSMGCPPPVSNFYFCLFGRFF
jgi:hypothetical protein